MEKINATLRKSLLGEEGSGSSGGLDNGRTSEHNSRDIRGWVGPWAMIWLCFEVRPLPRPTGRLYVDMRSLRLCFEMRSLLLLPIPGNAIIA